MSSQKCPQCGLVNFSSATECKRCQSALDKNVIPEQSQIPIASSSFQPAPHQGGTEPQRKYVTGTQYTIETETGGSSRIVAAVGAVTLLFALSFFVKTIILTKRADLAARRDNAVPAQTISESGFNNQEANDNRNLVSNNSNKLLVNNGYQETAKPALVDKSTPRSIPMPTPEPDTTAKPTARSANTSGGVFMEYSAPTPKPQGVFQRLSIPERSVNTGQTSSATQSREPMTVSGGVLNGKAVNLVKPPYPAAASAIRAAGTVNVQVTIGLDGNVISASAISGHPLLKQSAEYAARSSKFNPTILSGQKVKVVGVIVYNFTAQSF